MDGGQVWAVDVPGTPGCVVAPARVVEPLATHLTTSADQCPNLDYAVRAAFRDTLDAFADYVDDYRAGVA
ncbi:hypothetical protein [Streptomyces sp. NPDC059349]|uniref:hypothetical protein n=1 Tax=Streptomyces sp. NPDC059349 TaxID=3346808 RepID=UPI0036A9E92E